MCSPTKKRVLLLQVEAVLNRAAIGKTFRADAPKIVQALEDLASHDPQQALGLTSSKDTSSKDTSSKDTSSKDTSSKD